MEPTTVFRSFSPAEAQMVRARLETAGFHPFVFHELSSLSIGGYAQAAGGILVQVPGSEAEEAREFLDSDSDESTAP